MWRRVAWAVRTAAVWSHDNTLAQELMRWILPGYCIFPALIPHLCVNPPSSPFFKNVKLVLLPSHSAGCQRWGNLWCSVCVIAFSFPLSMCLSPYLSPTFSIAPSLPSHPLPSLSLHAHLIHITHHGSIRHSSPWSGDLFFSFFLFFNQRFFQFRLYPKLLPSAVDPKLTPEPLCFISSSSSWRGRFCWPTTLSTQTRSLCTFRASSVTTSPTPSRTRDRRTTARRRPSLSTPSSLPSPLWRWVAAFFVLFLAQVLVTT